MRASSNASLNWRLLTVSVNSSTNAGGIGDRHAQVHRQQHDQGDQANGDEQQHRPEDHAGRLDDVHEQILGRWRFCSLRGFRCSGCRWAPIRGRILLTRKAARLEERE